VKNLEKKYVQRFVSTVYLINDVRILT